MLLTFTDEAESPPVHKHVEPEPVMESARALAVTIQVSGYTKKRPPRFSAVCVKVTFGCTSSTVTSLPPLNRIVQHPLMK